MLLTTLRRLKLNTAAKRAAGRLVDLAEYSRGFHTPRGNYIPHRIALLRGRYEPSETAFLLQAARSARVILDIGANVGHFAHTMGSACQSAGGRVVAFEPNPAAFSFLARNTRHLGNVLPLRLGLSQQPGTAVLHTLNRNTEVGTLCRKTLEATAAHGSSIDTVTIQLVRADALLNALDVGQPDLIKMDVEGWELSALQSFGSLFEQWKKPLRILFEVNPGALQAAGTNLTEVCRFLLDRGFSLNELLPQAKLTPVSLPELQQRFATGREDYASLVAQR